MLHKLKYHPSESFDSYAYMGVLSVFFIEAELIHTLLKIITYLKTNLFIYVDTEIILSLR